jgi:hypothetical protein
MATKEEEVKRKVEELQTKLHSIFLSGPILNQTKMNQYEKIKSMVEEKIKDEKWKEIKIMLNRLNKKNTEKNVANELQMIHEENEKRKKEENGKRKKEENEKHKKEENEKPKKEENEKPKNEKSISPNSSEKSATEVVTKPSSNTPPSPSPTVSLRPEGKSNISLSNRGSTILKNKNIMEITRTIDSSFLNVGHTIRANVNINPHYMEYKKVQDLKDIQSIDKINNEHINWILFQSGLAFPQLSDDPKKIVEFVGNILTVLSFYSHFIPFPNTFLSYIKVHDPLEKMKKLFKKYNDTLERIKKSVTNIQQIIKFITQMKEKLKMLNAQKALNDTKKELLDTKRELVNTQKKLANTLTITEKNSSKATSPPITTTQSNQTEKSGISYTNMFYKAAKTVTNLGKKVTNLGKKAVGKILQHGEQGKDYIFEKMTKFSDFISDSALKAIFYVQVTTHIKNMKNAVRSILFFRIIHCQIKEEIRIQRESKKIKDTDTFTRQKLHDIELILESTKFGNKYYRIRTGDRNTTENQNNKNIQECIGRYK